MYPNQSADFPIELVDKTIGNLHNSLETMRACALVCRDWQPIARSHLYHSLNYNHRSMLDLSRTADRLHELFEKNAGYTVFIREVSIYWSVVFAASLMEDINKFTRLEKLSLKYLPWAQITTENIEKVQTVFQSPTLKSLVLHTNTFEDINQFASFFNECRSNVKSLTFVDTVFLKESKIELNTEDRPRATLQSLSLVRSHLGIIIPWFLHPQCPIDLKELRHLSWVDGRHLSQLRELLGVVGPSIRDLEVKSPSDLISAEDINISPTVLPQLAYITITGIDTKSLPSAVILVSQLTSAYNIKSITLVVDIAKVSIQPNDPESTSQWERLDEVLHGLQLESLKYIQIIIKGNVSSAKEREETCNALKATLRKMGDQKQKTFKFF